MKKLCLSICLLAALGCTPIKYKETETIMPPRGFTEYCARVENILRAECK